MGYAVPVTGLMRPTIVVVAKVPGNPYGALVNSFMITPLRACRGPRQPQPSFLVSCGCNLVVGVMSQLTKVPLIVSVKLF